MDIKDLIEKSLDPLKTWVKGLLNDLEDRLHGWVDRRILELKIEMKKESAQVLMDSSAADQKRLDQQEKASG